MLPDDAGSVPKHKVKHTWTGAENDSQLWHFGRTFEEFTLFFTRLLEQQKWVPDCIVISSLTSYWHSSIEELLVRVCAKLGAKRRERVTIALYGNYPRLEPEHAAAQRDADAALQTTVNTQGCSPDVGLFLDTVKRPPAFYGLDVTDEKIEDHLAQCLDLQTAWQRRRGVSRPATITVAFFNDDVCSDQSRLAQVARFAE